MKSYTLNELEKIEKEYRGASVLRILREGKWETVRTDKYPATEAFTGVRGEYKKLSDVMTFVDYIKEGN